MKKTLTTAILLLSLSFSVYGLIPQQPMSPEKKSAMHKLDPVDIFPQVRERSGTDRNRNNHSSKSSTGPASTESANSSSQRETRSRSRKNSRGRHSPAESLPTNLAVNASASPTPAIGSISATPEPTATGLPAATSDSTVALAEPVSKKADPPPQTLAAMSTLRDDGIGGQNKLLSLPIILALLVIVLIALVLVFAKLIRYLRGPAV